MATLVSIILTPAEWKICEAIAKLRGESNIATTVGSLFRSGLQNECKNLILAIGPYAEGLDLERDNHDTELADIRTDADAIEVREANGGKDAGN